MAQDKRWEVMAEHLKKAGKIAFLLPDSEIEDRVYPIWVAMIHTLLIEVGQGCPCTHGNPEDCFLVQKPDYQKELLRGGDIAFEEFLTIVNRARERVFASLKPDGSPQN